MHLVNGVGKKILKLLLEKYKDQLRIFLDNEMGTIQTSKNLFNRVRPASQFAHWRSHEFRSFFLFFGPIILQKFPLLDCEQKVCTLLGEIIFLSNLELNTDRIVEILKGKVLRFFQEFTHAFGQMNITINVHEMIHLPLSPFSFLM